MSKSNLLDDVCEGSDATCFKCLNFKVKPFNVKNENDSLNDISIKLRVTKEEVRCVKNALNVNSSIIEKVSCCDSKEVMTLSSSLKSSNRYSRIALYCNFYDAD